MMRNSHSISNTLWIYSFLGISSVILIGGAVFVLTAYRMLDYMGNDSISLTLVITIVPGVTCLIAMPYCFRVSRTMCFVDISYSDPNNMKVTIHPIASSDGVLLPTELQLDQLTSILRDKIFENLMEFTFEARGEKKTITSFIKKEKMNFIRNLPRYQPA